jgi:hypothetical protein
MPKSALTKVRNYDADLAAEAHEKRVVAELNAQHLALRDQAQALIATVKGRRGIQSDEHWQALFQKAKIDYDKGRFLLQQLGAERVGKNGAVRHHLVGGCRAFDSCRSS